MSEELTIDSPIVDVWVRNAITDTDIKMVYDRYGLGGHDWICVIGCGAADCDRLIDRMKRDGDSQSFVELERKCRFMGCGTPEQALQVAMAKFRKMVFESCKDNPNVIRA